MEYLNKLITEVSKTDHSEYVVLSKPIELTPEEFNYLISHPLVVETYPFTKEYISGREPIEDSLREVLRQYTFNGITFQEII